MIKFILYTSTFLTFIFIVVLLTVYLIQHRLIFYPEKLSKEYNYYFNLPYNELFIKTADDAEINALHFKAPNSKGLILYFHGNSGSLQSWGSIAEDFISRNYDFFIIDYRTFGKSTGPFTEEALHHDAQVVYDYLLKNGFDETDIIIYGRSIGTGIAVRLAATNKPASLILETPYYNLADLAQKYYPFIPTNLVLRFKLQSDKWIRKVSCPVYIFHGTADEVVPYSSGLKLAKIIGEENLITIKNGNHNNLGMYPQYQRVLDSILH